MILLLSYLVRTEHGSQLCCMQNSYEMVSKWYGKCRIRHGFYMNVVFCVWCWKICETLLIIRLMVSCCYWILYLGILTFGFWQHSESVGNALFILKCFISLDEIFHWSWTRDEYSLINTTSCGLQRSVVCPEACLPGPIQHNSVNEDRIHLELARNLHIEVLFAYLCLFVYVHSVWILNLTFVHNTWCGKKNH